MQMGFEGFYFILFFGHYCCSSSFGCFCFSLIYEPVVRVQNRKHSKNALLQIYSTLYGAFERSKQHIMRGWILHIKARIQMFKKEKIKDNS